MDRYIQRKHSEFPSPKSLHERDRTYKFFIFLCCLVFNAPEIPKSYWRSGAHRLLNNKRLDLYLWLLDQVENSINYFDFSLSGVGKEFMHPNTYNITK